MLKFLQFFNSGVPGNLATAALLGLITWWYASHRRRFKERGEARKHQFHLWNLIGEKKDDGDRAIALLDAINAGAIDRAQERSNPPARKKSRWGSLASLRKTKVSPEKARAIWNPVASELFAAEHDYVAPGATATDGVRARRGNAIDVVKDWLSQCRGRDTSESTGRISIRAAGGTGKTIFMHRLLLQLSAPGKSCDASASHRAPAPMFASAETVQRNVHMIAHLQNTEDTLTTFVDVWLKNRSIVVPEESKPSLIDDFKDGLTSGKIVLLVDGDDELRDQGLERFALNLLSEVRYWVVAHRPGPELIKTERRLTFDDSWDESNIDRYIDARLGSDPKKRDLVKRVIADVLRRHQENLEKSEAASEQDGAINSARLTQAEPHWLSQPRNLDVFLQAIESGDIQTESEIRQSAEDRPHLFEKVVLAAVKKIDATKDFDAIRDRLCEVAVNDPTNTRRQAGDRPVKIDDRIASLLRKMTELVGFSDKQNRFYFKHSALRGYFIAGQVARELADPFHDLVSNDELARDEAWSAAKQVAIQRWLPEMSSGDHAASVASRLRRGQQHAVPLKPIMRRNLLELLVWLELSNNQRGDIESLVNLDLSGIAGNRLDLHLMKLDRCDFTEASLVDSELTYSTFNECDFKRADLSGADAVGAAFNDCTFGADGVDPARVGSMAIDRAEFTLQGTPARLQRELLIQRGASLERSRYRGEFGKKFFAAQKAFLGPGVERLERDHYVRAIEEAVGEWMKKDSSSPIYVVDLMAGGSYDRIADLRKKFDSLHILGIDRDPSAKPLDSRFQWAQFEIGKDSTRDEVALGFDISTSLRKFFGAGAALAHIIVAKKAFHEIDRDRQQLLMQECARSLRPGGRLILFEDTPGIVDGDVPRDLSQTLSGLDRLRRKLGDDVEDGQHDKACEPEDVVNALAGLSYDTSAAQLIGFANTWIMVKDWANQNRHEVRNRYFASVPEIKEWAKGIFGEPRETKSDHYRLNPLMFNELGIQRVLDHLTREGGNGAQIVRRDEAILSEWMWQSERLKVLVDFTREHLAPNKPLTMALDAKDESIDLTPIDTALGLLNRSDITAPTFNLPCTVLVFEKA